MKYRKGITPHSQSGALLSISSPKRKGGLGWRQWEGRYKHISPMHTFNDINGPSPIVILTYKDSSKCFINNIKRIYFSETFEHVSHETEVQVFSLASDIDLPTLDSQKWDLIPLCRHLLLDDMLGPDLEEGDHGNELSVETTGCEEVLVSDVAQTA